MAWLSETTQNLSMAKSRRGSYAHQHFRQSCYANYERSYTGLIDLSWLPNESKSANIPVIKTSRFIQQLNKVHVHCV